MGPVVLAEIAARHESGLYFRIQADIRALHYAALANDVGIATPVVQRGGGC